MVVLHAMAEYVKVGNRYYHAVEWLKKKGWSAHIFVTPSGTIIRSRNDNQGAYHAAAQGYNKISLGVEFLVAGVHDIASLYKTIQKPYLKPEQYKAGVEFVKKEWVLRAGILRYVEHSRLDPEKKKDPGAGFPLCQFLKDIGVIT